MTTTLRQLTRNFHEREFFVNEDPPLQIRETVLPRVAALAQWLRDLTGSPGVVTSYWRSPARNARVSPEAKDSSQHMTGEAVDISFPLISDRELAHRVNREIKAGRAPAFGQLIFYPDTTHVHISLPGASAINRHRIMVGRKKPGGGRQYATLTRFDELPSLPSAVGLLIFFVGTAIASVFFFPVSFVA